MIYDFTNTFFLFYIKNLRHKWDNTDKFQRSARFEHGMLRLKNMKL